MKKLIYIFVSVFSLSYLTSRAQPSNNIELLFHWKDTSLVASWAHDNTYNEVWGYEQAGREYAIIGTTMGTHIFDITDPVNSSEVSFIEGRVTGTPIIHRDYHTYQNYLYAVCDEGISSLQIIDLSDLPTSTEVVYDSTDLLIRAHNIFIDTTHAKLYQAGGFPTIGVQVFSLQDPTYPTPIDSVWLPGTSHDLFVHDDTAYINMGNAGLFIYDFSQIGSPQQIGLFDGYTDEGYNHSGWLDPEKDLYVMADETHGSRMKLLDVSDLDNIEEFSLMHSDINALSISHNQIIKSGLVYNAHYHDGVYVYDINDAESPTLFGYYDTSNEPHANNYRGAWGVYPYYNSGNFIVSDMQEGLFVFGFINAPNSPLSQKIARPNTIKVFPNPAKDLVQIDTGEPLTSYKLFDLNGSLVQSGITKQFDISHFSKGIYTLKVKTNQSTSVLKIIKQ